MLTSCPPCRKACLADATRARPLIIVVEMAKHLLGAGWMRRYVDSANRGEHQRIYRILPFPLPRPEAANIRTAFRDREAEWLRVA